MKMSRLFLPLMVGAVTEGAHLRHTRTAPKSLSHAGSSGWEGQPVFVQQHAAGTLATATGVLTAVVGQYTLQTSMDSVVAALLEEQGSVSLGHIVKQIHDKMSLQDALHRLGDILPKLPTAVAALAHVGDRTRSAGNFSEDSLQKARRILNDMVQASQAELDDAIIDCQEFKRSNRRTFDQVVTDLARLGSEIASTDEKVIESLTCITNEDAVFKSLSDTLQDEQHTYFKTRVEDDAELTLKKKDLAVFNFIMDITKCREGSPGNGELFLQVGTNQTHPVRVCSTNIGFELNFDDPKIQREVDTMMTPAARLALRDALGLAFPGNLPQGAFLQQDEAQDPAGPTLTVASTSGRTYEVLKDFDVGSLCFADRPIKFTSLGAFTPANGFSLVKVANDDGSTSNSKVQFTLQAPYPVTVYLLYFGTGMSTHAQQRPWIGSDGWQIENAIPMPTWDDSSQPLAEVRKKSFSAGTVQIMGNDGQGNGSPVVFLGRSSLCIATVYEYGNFTGWQASYVEGAYDFKAFLERGAKDDEVSSLRVAGDCTATVYQHGDFTGWSGSFAAGSYNLADMNARGVKDAEASAIRVERVTSSPAPTFTGKPVAVKEDPAPEQQWKKCTDGKPNCGLLHDTMSLQWGKFKDLVDELQAEMEQDQDEWDKLKANLNDQLKATTDQKSECQTKFDQAVGTKNRLTQERNEKDTQHHELTVAHDSKMAICKARIDELLYTDVCAVRTVRNQVLKVSVVSPSLAIVDCEVDDWVAEPCSVECDDSCPHVVGRHVDPYACGGWMVLNRKAIVQANQFGIACPDLQRKTRCGQFKCSVDCTLSEWSGWSKCTKECEGGAQQMTRSVITKPKHGGQACAGTVDTRACNTGSCDRDCSLGEWSAWSHCSMACDPGDMPGFQERTRSVLVPIRGEGKCPQPVHPERYEKQTCNEQACVGDEFCVAKQDLIIAIDASGSMRETGFEVFRDFAANLTTKYKSQYLGAEAVHIGVVLFGNGVRQADETISPAISIVGLTGDLAMVAGRIRETTWQKGFTNMAQAFVLADTMFQQGGRADAQSAVLMLSDGRYSFAFETQKAVDTLKQKNTMVFMAPVAARAGDWQHKLKEWASQPWETNYELIPGVQDLEHNMGIFAGVLLAKFCSDAVSPSAEIARADERGYMLIHEGGLPDNTCGRYYDMGYVATVAECKKKAEEDMGVAAFAVGTEDHKRTKHCYAEAVSVTPENWTVWQHNRADIPCPGGGWLDNPIYDVYAIEPSGGGESIQ